MVVFRVIFLVRKFSMNEKGQAFDTFKLLIAAIVAIAILTILFQIFGLIPTNLLQSNPTEAAADKLKTATNKLALAQTTKDVVFDRTNNEFSNRPISKVSGVPIGPEQICVLRGYFADNPEFEFISEGQSISYKGNSPKPAKITVLCDSGAGELASDLEQQPLLAADVEKDGGLATCGSLPACTESSTETCCIIVLRSGGGA
ncbi:MAG: hypothetical protein HY394_01535 [Candidatus Diapherotrites archaeon]|nr:hypothetical protein [Candidatus Diapherotrites archaeon]